MAAHKQSAQDAEGKSPTVVRAISQPPNEQTLAVPRTFERSNHSTAQHTERERERTGVGRLSFLFSLFLSARYAFTVPARK